MTAGSRANGNAESENYPTNSELDYQLPDVGRPPSRYVTDHVTTGLATWGTL